MPGSGGNWSTERKLMLEHREHANLWPLQQQLTCIEVYCYCRNMGESDSLPKGGGYSHDHPLGTPTLVPERSAQASEEMGMGVHSNAGNLVGTRPPFNPATNTTAVSAGGEQSVISGHREFAIISWVKPRRQRRFAVGFHSASGDMRGHE